MTNPTRAEIEKLLTDTRSDAGCGFGECQKDAILTHLLTQIDALREALEVARSATKHCSNQPTQDAYNAVREALAQTEHLKSPQNENPQEIIR
jgi:hypothetical protein